MRLTPVVLKGLAKLLCVSLMAAGVTDPAAEGLVRRVLGDDTRMRDVQVVEEIAQRWRDGQSLFVVFGASHAVIQEPALRALLCARRRGAECRFEAL